MKKYFVVDCDNPVPESEEQACSRRISYRLMKKFCDNPEEKACPRRISPTGTNIIIGVTRGNVSRCETELQIAMHMINRKFRRDVFKNYCVLNVETCHIEAGLDSPPDIEGELHILSDRPRTQALFRDKNCWWNKHAQLKRSIEKISKQKNVDGHHYREGCQILHVSGNHRQKGKVDKKKQNLGHIN
uniref:Wsv270-like protein n=1 Tax=Sesarmops intermedium nimavirus TaxID=2133796 RepID=A0A401IPS8_9VIRU|nr:MAG: wsv270-like protein [Sesarmops intermedium nimavirus]GBG35600.1 wsv270-like protein [Sesarmops intermedium nimavirus]